MASKSRFSLEAIFSAKDKLSAPLAKIRTGLSAFGKSAQGALGKANKAVDAGMRGVGRFSTAIGVGAVASVGTLGLALRQTIVEGTEFERTMTFAAAQFPGMIKAGTKEFEALKLAARQVGDDTEFSAQQGAEALTLLATAGLDAKQAIAALPKVVNFAMAAQIEMADASTFANDTMGAFSLTSKNAAKNAANMGRVMDVLTRAAADSTTNVSELYEAIKMGGPIAKTAGASIEDFVAMAGVLAKVGIKGGEAGTAIRNSFLELGAPSSAATKGLKKLGIQVQKTKDGGIDMTATIGKFVVASKKMTKAQKITALGAVFGQRTIGPFIALMDAGVDVIGEMEKSLNSAKGTTEGMSKVMSGDALGALRQFDSLLAGLRLDVFEAVREPMLAIVKATSEWVTANRGLIKTKAGEWATALKENLPAIWMWTVRVAKAFAGFMVVAATVRVATVAVAGFELAMKLAEGVAWLFGKSMTAAKWAINGVNVATIRARIATVALKIAQLASRAATLLQTAAMWAYKVPLDAALLSTIRARIATVGLKIAQLASRAATVIATAAMWAYRTAMMSGTIAQTAYTAVVTTSSGALAAFRVAALSSVAAIGAQAAAMAPMLITLGAAAAAVMALVAAWDQYNKLDKALAGSGGITGTVGKMWEMGTIDPFKAHDAVMNEKAVADRKKREAPQIVTPAERAARETVEAGGGTASVDGHITVEAKKGTSAEVKAKPRNVGLKMQPSGAFP